MVELIPSRRLRFGYGAALLNGTAFVGSDLSSAQVSEPPRVEMFLNSLGMNIHIDQGYAPQSYVAPLKFLGVRAVRTGAGNVQGSIYVSKQTGLLVDIFQNGGRVQDFLAAGRALAAANALLSFKGPNEPNNFPMTYEGKQGGGKGSWLPVAQFQRDVYAAVKSDAAPVQMLRAEAVEEVPLLYDEGFRLRSSLEFLADVCSARSFLTTLK